MLETVELRRCPGCDLAMRFTNDNLEFVVKNLITSNKIDFDEIHEKYCATIVEFPPLATNGFFEKWRHHSNDPDTH